MRALMLSKALVAGPYQRKAELIAAAGVDLVVAVPSFWRDGDRLQPLERMYTRGYRLVETPIRRPGDFHLHHYPSLGRLLSQTAPEVVHVDEEPYNLATFLALRAARANGARTLFFTWQNLNRRYPPPFGWFERYAYRTADGAIAGSQMAADVLTAKGFRGRLWVIPQFGVDPEVFHPPLARRRGHPLRIGFAGRLVPGKGVDLLLDAVSLLEVPWQLAIVGDGPERSTLALRAADLGILGQVTFTSWLAAAAVPRFFRQLDVLVLPSRSTPAWIEQFGRVLIEAMACETVCVGSDSGEIPQVLGSAGLVFAENDAAALRAQLARLAADAGLRQQLGVAGRQRVLAQFTMQRVAEATVAAYRTLVPPPGAQPAPPTPGR